MVCTKCVFDSKNKNKNPEVQMVNYDDELCEVTCSHGHITHVVIQNNKYELLFDSAVISFFDGYYRESVLNASSCLENFMEYFIKIMLFTKKGIDLSSIDNFYKKIKTRSECREGVFYAMYRIYLDKEYYWDNASKKLRNNTIHN